MAASAFENSARRTNFRVGETWCDVGETWTLTLNNHTDDRRVAEAIVTHADIRSFAEDEINLRKEKVSEYRGQVDHLGEELARKIAANPGFGLVKMLHSGSAAKGTALSDIDDLDVAVYVKKEEVDERNVLGWMKERLREAYPNKDPGDFSICDHCVRIHFRGTGLDVDVVPVIYEGDEDDYGYLIEKETGAHLLTSIPRHLEFIRGRKSNAHFAQVVRLVKWWAKQRKDENPDFRCKSFLLELLVARMLDSGSELDDYPLVLAEFFNYITKTGLKERVEFHDYFSADEMPNSTGAAIEVLDPVNPRNNVTSQYSADDRNALVEAAQDAADAIREARYSDTKKRAVELWQTVLGPYFGG